MAVQVLGRREQDMVRDLRCPYCDANHKFKLGPRFPEGRLMLCGVCFREYSVGMFTVSVRNEICPADRLKAVYGIELRTTRTEVVDLFEEEPTESRQGPRNHCGAGMSSEGFPL